MSIARTRDLLRCSSAAALSARRATSKRSAVSGRAQHRVERRCKPLPAFELGAERAFAGGGDPVVTGLPVVVGDALSWLEGSRARLRLLFNRGAAESQQSGARSAGSVGR